MNSIAKKPVVKVVGCVLMTALAATPIRAQEHPGRAAAKPAVPAAQTAASAGADAAAPTSPDKTPPSAPPQPENVELREKAQSYFEDDQARKGVATLAQAARANPTDRILGAMLYSSIRDHVWHMPQTLPLKHEGAVHAVTFSPDTHWLASGSESGEVFIWPTEPKDEEDLPGARTVLPKSDGAIIGLAFSADGSALAIVSKGSGARVWNVAEKKFDFETPKPAQAVTAFTKGAPAQIVAYGTADGSIVVVDYKARKEVAELRVPDVEIKALAISRTGEFVAAACSDRMLRVWKLDGKALAGEPIAHPQDITSIDFSYDDRYVLTGGKDGIARLWNPRENILVMPQMPCGAPILKARVSTDGSVMEIMLSDGTVRFWDAFTGKKLPGVLREDAPFHDFTPARASLRGATASDDGHATIWTLRNGTQRGETIPVPGKALVVEFSPDATMLATGTSTGEARVWRSDDGKPLPTVRHHWARARSAFYSADGDHLITTSEDHTALHWISGQVHPFGPALRHAGRVTCGVFNEDASKILTCDDSGIAQLWIAATGQPDGAPYKHKAPVNWVDFHPDGKRLVTASGPNATIWSVNGHVKPLRVLTHPGKSKGKVEMKSARFSPDGKWLVTVSTDGTAHVWDGTTYQHVAVIDRHAPMLCGRFSPDSSLLVVGGEDAQAIAYDTATWKPVGTPILATGPVFSAAFTGDNRFLVISSLLLEAVKFFEVKTGRALNLGLGINAQATCVDYHIQDKVVVMACDDGSVRAVESPFVDQDVPPWVCDFAERVVGLRKTGPDQFEPVQSHMEHLRNFVSGAARATNFDFPRLVRWAMSAGVGRNGMPRFVSTIGANVELRVNERSTEALYECYEASGGPLVLAALSLYAPNARHGQYLADLVLSLPDADPFARCFAASTLINSGRSAEAIPVVEKALADAPKDFRVLRRAGKIYARLQNRQRATELFEGAIAIEPNDFETRRTYGWMLYFFHMPADAAAQFQRCQELSGDMVDDVIAGLCLCSAMQMKKADAVAAYGRLVALDPEWKKASYFDDLRGWTNDQLHSLDEVRKAYLAKK